MNTRYITIFLALGMTAAIFLTHSHLSRLSPLPLAISPTAAQTPDPALIYVKAIPNVSNSDDNPWHHFEITVPQTNPPLDMHTAFLVDGHGQEIVDKQPQVRPQPMLFHYRLDYDDDSRVKDILEAQGLPVKKNLVTYQFASGTNGWISSNKTIHFRHEPGTQQWSEGYNDTIKAAVGTKILLENRMLSDATFKGDLKTVGTLEQQQQPGYAPETPPGMVHHLVVYIMFTPHQGAAVKGNTSVAREL